MSEARSQPGDDADEALLAEVFDDLLGHVLDGRTPDLDQVLPHRPDLRARIEQSYSLACSVAGRREPGRPVLGGYEIVRELGHGGMGTVYLARHQALDREVAIKILPQSLALSPRAKRRFLEEARALARIRHEHVVHLHRIVDHAEMLAFEMEYVDGPSLQHLLVELKQRGPASMAHVREVLGPAAAGLEARSTVEYFVRIGIAVARALDEVHRRGLIHRDVKPSNILLRRDGRPVLADFGLARQEDLAMTQTRAFAGTPLYAAPERLRDGDDQLDGRADVYSLGVTLYEAITLAPPYHGRSTDEVLRKIERGRLPPLRARAPNVSHDLQTVLEKAMEAEPRNRYATAAEFAADLERLLNLQPVQARPAGALRRLTKAARRHHRILLAGVCGALTVALAAWPMVVHAQTLASARKAAAQHADAARLELLSPECQPTVWALGRAGSFGDARGAAVLVQVQALQTARAEYDRALTLVPDDDALRAERAVIATVLWLRTQSPASKDAAAAAVASADFQAATRDLPPTSRAFACDWVTNTVDAADVRQRLASENADERFATGLLGLLLGDLAACEAAWADGDGTAEHPLVDAGLGLLYAADGQAERAYPRLFHASRAFPSALSLRFGLADAALAMGDAEPARAVLAQPLDDAPPVLQPRLELLRADVQALAGDLAAAERGCRQLLQRDPDAAPVLQRLARLAIERGNPAQARRLLDRALLAQPELARLHLDSARLALRTDDLVGYLAQARYALGHADADGTSHGGRADLREVLRLGGLQTLLDDGDETRPTDARDWRDVELALPRLPRSVRPANLAAALLLLRDWDRAADGFRRDPRPFAAPLRGTYALLCARPQLAGLLPGWALLAVHAGVQPLFRFAPSLANELLFPFQTSLGSPLEHIAVVPMPDPDPDALGELRYAHALAATAGDDGETWLLIGSPPIGNGTLPGKAIVRSGRDGAVLNAPPVADPRTMYGYATAWLGDLDGDGAPDYAVGAPSRNADAMGHVLLHSGRDGRVLRDIRGAAIGFGVAVCGLGDVDGDRVPDLAVGTSPLLRSNRPLGSATIISGSSGSVLRELECDRAGVWFGAAVGNVGDVDGDGIADLAIGGNLGGAPGYVRVHSGRDGHLLHTFAEESSGSLFGRSVGSAGDLDADGCADVAVCAPGGPRDESAGRVLVYSGRTGALLARFTGDSQGDQFGVAVLALAPLQKDSRPGIAIGAARGGPTGGGYVRVFDLRSQQPLRSFFSPAGFVAFGAAIADLGLADGVRFLAIAGEGDGRGISWRIALTPPTANGTERPR